MEDPKGKQVLDSNLKNPTSGDYGTNPKEYKTFNISGENISEEDKKEAIKYANDVGGRREWGFYKPAEGSDVASGDYPLIVDYAGKQNANGDWQFDRYNTLVGYDGKRAKDAPNFVDVDSDGNVTVNATGVFLNTERGKNAFENVFGTADNPKHFNSSNVAQYNNIFNDAYNNAQKESHMADTVRQIRQVEDTVAQSILGAETNGKDLNLSQKLDTLDNIKHSGRMLYQNYSEILAQGDKLLEDFKNNKNDDTHELTYNKINADGSVETKKVGLTVGQFKELSKKNNGEFERALTGTLISQNGKNTTLSDAITKEHQNVKKDSVYTDGTAFYAGNKLGLTDNESAVAMAGLLQSLRGKLYEDYSKGEHKYNDYGLGTKTVQETNVAISDFGNTVADNLGSTATGVGGTILATAGAGAVAGSVVPGAGTAVGAVVGVVGGITATLLFGAGAQKGVDDLLGRSNKDTLTGYRAGDMNRLNTDTAKALQNKGDITRNGAESITTFLGVAVPAAIEIFATKKAGGAAESAGKSFGTFVASLSKNATEVGLKDALSIARISSRSLSAVGRNSASIENAVAKMTKTASSITDDVLKSQADDIIKHTKEIGKTTANLEALGSKTASAEKVALESTRATQLELYNAALNSTLKGEGVVAKNLTNLGKAINNLSAPARASVSNFISSSSQKIGSSEFAVNTIESLGRLGNKIQPVLGNLSRPYDFAKNIFTEKLIDKSVGWLGGVMRASLPSENKVLAKTYEFLTKDHTPLKAMDKAMGTASKFMQGVGNVIVYDTKLLGNWGVKQLIPRLAMDMVSDMAKANAHYANTDTGYRSLFSRTPQEYFDNMTQSVLNAPRAFSTDGNVDTAQRMMYLLGAFSTLSQTGTFRLVSDSAVGSALNSLFAKHIATRTGLIFRNSKIGKMYSKYFGTDGDRNGVSDFLAHTYINSKNATPEQYRVYRSIADNPEGQAEATVKVQLERRGFEQKAKETIQFLKDNKLFQETKEQKTVFDFDKKAYDKLSKKEKKAYTPVYDKNGEVHYTSEVQGFMKPEVAQKQNLMSQLEVLKKEEPSQAISVEIAIINDKINKLGGISDIDKELYKHIHDLNRISNEVGMSVGVVTPNKFINTNIDGAKFENYNSIYYNRASHKVLNSPLDEIDPVTYGAIGKTKTLENQAYNIINNAIDPITAVLQKNSYTVGAAKKLLTQRFQFAKNFANEKGVYYSFDDLSEFLGVHTKSVERANRSVLTFLNDRLDSRIKYQKLIDEATSNFTDMSTFTKNVKSVVDSIKQDIESNTKYINELEKTGTYHIFEEFNGEKLLKDDVIEHLKLKADQLDKTLDSLSNFLSKHSKVKETVKKLNKQLDNSMSSLERAKMDFKTAKQKAVEFSRSFSAQTADLAKEVNNVRNRMISMFDEEVVKIAPDLPSYSNSLSTEKMQEKFSNISLMSDTDKAIARISNDELTSAVRELQTIYGNDWKKIYAVLNTSDFQHGLMANINRAVNPFSVPKELNFNYKQFSKVDNNSVLKALEDSEAFKSQQVFDPAKYKANNKGFRTLADDNEIASLRVARDTAKEEIINITAEYSRLKNAGISKVEPKKIIKSSKKANALITDNAKIKSEIRSLHGSSVEAYNQGIEKLNSKYKLDLKKAPVDDIAETQLGLKSIYEEMNETQIKAGYEALENIDKRIAELETKQYPTREFSFSDLDSKRKEIAKAYAGDLNIDKAVKSYNDLIAEAKKEIRKYQRDIDKVVPLNDEVVVSTRNALKSISRINPKEIETQLYVRELANRMYEESGFGNIELGDAFMKSRKFVTDSEAYAKQMAREFELARDNTKAPAKNETTPDKSGTAPDKIEAKTPIKTKLEMPEVANSRVKKATTELERVIERTTKGRDEIDGMFANINDRPVANFLDKSEDDIISINNELKGDIIDAVAEGRLSQENATFINKFLNNKFTNGMQNIFRNFVTGGFNLTGANIPRNAFRDMWSSYMANGTVGAFDNFSPTGLIKAFGGNAPNEVNTLWKELMRQTTVENTIANTMKTKDFLKTLGFKKVSKWANIRDILETPMNFTERLGRQANFDNAYKTAIKKGMDELEAIEYARAVGLNATADFGKKLGITRKFLRTASYLNATFAGSRSMKLMLQTDPAGAVSRIALAIAYTSALAANNQRTAEQRAKWDTLPPYIKYSGLTFISDDGKDITYIPLPNEFQFVLSVGDLMTSVQRNKQYKSQVYSNVLSGLTQLVSPFDLTGFFRDDKLEADPLKGVSRLAGQFVPQPARILYSTLTGKDLYFGDNIYKGSGKLGEWAMKSVGFTPDTKEEADQVSRKIYGALAGLIGGASADVLIGGINTLNATGDFWSGATKSATDTLGKTVKRDGDLANQLFWEMYSNRAEEKKELMDRVAKIQQSAVGKNELQKQEANKKIQELLAGFTNKVKNDLVEWNARFGESEIKKGDHWGDEDKMNTKVSKVLELLNYEPPTDDKTNQAMGKYNAVQRFSNFGINDPNYKPMPVVKIEQNPAVQKKLAQDELQAFMDSQKDAIQDLYETMKDKSKARATRDTLANDYLEKTIKPKINELIGKYGYDNTASVKEFAQKINFPLSSKNYKNYKDNIIGAVVNKGEYHELERGGYGIVAGAGADWQRIKSTGLIDKTLRDIQSGAISRRDAVKFTYLPMVKYLANKYGRDASVEVTRDFAKKLYVDESEVRDIVGNNQKVNNKSDFIATQMIEKAKKVADYNPSYAKSILSKVKREADKNRLFLSTEDYKMISQSL